MVHEKKTEKTMKTELVLSVLELIVNTGLVVCLFVYLFMRYKRSAHQSSTADGAQRIVIELDCDHFDQLRRLAERSGVTVPEYVACVLREEYPDATFDVAVHH